MKKWVLVTLAAILLAPAAFGANTAVNQAMADADVSPGELVVAQRIQINASANSGLWYVVVRNTDGTAAQLTDAGVEKVEVVRESDDRVIGTQSNANELAKLTSATTGVSVQIQSTYRAFATTLAVQVRVKLKSSVALGAKLKLGWATVDVRTPSGSTTASSVTVTGAAPRLTVGPSPIVEFDGAVPDAEAYRGERFLAGRIAVDAGAVPFNFTISQVVLTNKAITGTLLSGSSIARIEIRRASDAALLGEQTTDTELSKLTTTGCKVTTSSNNETSAYGVTQLEIWVTLEASVPVGRKLQFEAKVRCGGTDFAAGDGPGPAVDGPVFTSTQAAGFETVANLSLDGGQVYTGQRFLAQRIEVSDSDVAPFDVTVTSLVIQNVADSAVRLAENRVVRIDVVRARDGAVMGSVTGASGLNGGGVRVTTSSSNVVTDDSSAILEIWITLGASVPDERVLQLKTVIWHSEDSTTFGHVLPDAGPEFITGPAVGEGFATATSSTELVSRTVLSGGRFLAQRLVLTDSDADPYDVTVASVMIRNVVGDNWLADQNVARLEVRRKSDGALLGEVVDPVGLSLAGVRVTASANNIVRDDSTVTLEIWVTLKLTAPTGRKLELESIVWHTEGVATFQTAALAGPAIFTTKVGTPPSNVNFTWTPAAPKYNQEVTFTPAATIADPEGAIAKATYSWKFGDGKTASTTGTAAVKHTYTTGGSFSVVLTVTGEAGLSSSKTNAVAVEGPPNVVPTVAFTWTPQAPAEKVEVTFTSTVTDSDQPAGTAFTYAWNFGDTATSAVANPKHTFAEKKTYTVKLIVTDARGAAVTVEHTISVGNTLPVVATLTASNVSPNTGDVVTFTATAMDADSDTIAKLTWDFGDGTAVQTTTTGTTGTTTHTYAAPGTRTMSVTATDSRGAVSVAKTLSITVAGPDRILLIIYPNPAKTQATVRCILPSGVTEPVLVIYSLGGDIVLRQELTAGQVYPWNLLDAAGNKVGNGLYFCVVTATAAGGGSVRSDVFRLLVVR